MAWIKNAMIVDGTIQWAKMATGTVALSNLAAGILAASATGRGKIATGFFDAATVADKFAADSFTNAVLLQLVQDGAFAASTATRALFAEFVS